MDCRNHIVLALGLLAAAGCVPDNSVQPDASQRPPVVEKAKELPKHPPRSAETCVALGNFFADGGNHSEQGSAQEEHRSNMARKEYQQALEIDPNCVSAYLALGRLAINMSDYTEAVKWYRKGLERMPREGSLWLNLGMCYARHKDWTQAVDALHHATGCDPDNKKYYGMLGFCLAYTGQIDQALSAFEKGYGETLAHYHLARILFETHHDAEAMQQVKIVTQKEPTYKPAQRLLAQLEGREPADAAVAPAGFDAPADGEAMPH